MKASTIFSIFVLLLFLFSACNSIAPTPTVPVQAPETGVPAQATKTEAPTTEVSPTPAGPKEGDTKVENGYTYTYTDIQANGKEVYTGWFRPMTPTAIPMIDWPWMRPDGTQGKDIAPITIMVEEGVPGGDAIQAFTHIPIPKGPGNNRYLGYMITAFSNNDNAVWAQVMAALQAGTKKYSVQFGNTSYDWSPSPNHGSIVYVLNYTNPVLSAKEYNWEDGPYYKDHQFKAAFWGLDSQGNTVGAIASQTPLNQLNKDELSIFPFYHVASIIGGSGSDLALYFGGYSQLLQHMMQNSLNSVPPYVEVSTQTPSPSPTP